MLRDRQFGDMRDQPCGERQFAERRGDLVLAAERGERGARSLLALRNPVAPRGEKTRNRRRVRRQVVRKRDHACLAGRERLVQ